MNRANIFLLTALLWNCNGKQLDVVTSTSTDGTSGVTSSGTASEGGQTSDGSSGQNISCVGDPDLNGDCDIWCQDCGSEAKCVLFGPVPNVMTKWIDTKCHTVSTPAKKIGDDCTIVNGETEWIDDCETGSMCLAIYNKDSGMPTCVEMCGGSPDSPQCPEPARCVTYGHLPLCARLCDPLDPNHGCPETCQAVDQSCDDCFPMTAEGTFTCGISISEASVGSPCTYQSHCTTSLYCAPSQRFPDCSEDRCCTPYCDLNAPSCPMGMKCFETFEPGAAPKGVEHVGVCLLPE